MYAYLYKTQLSEPVGQEPSEPGTGGTVRTGGPGTVRIGNRRNREPEDPGTGETANRENRKPEEPLK